MENTSYTATQIDDKSWFILDEIVRIFLFTGTKSALLVDTGFGTGDLKTFAETLTDLPIILVNTHADPDHTGGNAVFPVAHMHTAEFSRYAARPEGGAVLPLWEGDKIDLGGRVFEIIHIPGHTPGSIALLDRENRIILGGDSVSASSVFIFGEGRSIPAIIASLKKLNAMSDAFDTIYTSHGPFPIGKEAVSAQLEAAEQLLAGKLVPQPPPEYLGPIPAKMYVHGEASFLYD